MGPPIALSCSTSHAVLKNSATPVPGRLMTGLRCKDCVWSCRLEYLFFCWFVGLTNKKPPKKLKCIAVTVKGAKVPWSETTGVEVGRAGGAMYLIMLGRGAQYGVIRLEGDMRTVRLCPSPTKLTHLPLAVIVLPWPILCCSFLCKTSKGRKRGLGYNAFYSKNILSVVSETRKDQVTTERKMIFGEPNTFASIQSPHILSEDDLVGSVSFLGSVSSPQYLRTLNCAERVSSASPRKVPVPPSPSSTHDRPYLGRSFNSSMSSSWRTMMSPPTETPSTRERKRPSISISVAFEDSTEKHPVQPFKSDDTSDGSVLSLNTPSGVECCPLFLPECNAQRRSPLPEVQKENSEDEEAMKALKHKTSTFLKRIPVSVLLGFRRMLRRNRESKLFNLRLKRPSVDALRRDAFLDTYSSKTLSKFAEALQIRYFFPGELVISRGVIERECYVVCSGSLRVVKTGDPPVAVLGVGSVVGSYGFTLEVPRSASVIASPDAPCLLWCITRTAFEWMDDKEAEWRRLFSLFHRDLLQNQFIKRFPCFSGVSDHSLEILLKSGVPMSVNKGEPLSLKRSNPIYVVVGSVKVTIGITSQGSSQGSVFDAQCRSSETVNHDALLLESLSRIVDVHAASEMTESVRIDQRAPPSREAGSPLTPFLSYRKATINAPCVLGAFPAVYPEDALGNVRIDAVSSAEVLVLQWSVLDELAKAQVAQNCDSRRQRRAQRLDRNEVREVLFGELPHFLRVKNHDHVVVQKLVTFQPGDTIEFDYASGMNALIVQRGELDMAVDSTLVEREVVQPPEKAFRLWPDIALIYFGSKQKIAARSTVTGCLVSRRQIVAHLALHSTDAELGLLVRHFNERYSSLHSCGERPIFASMPPPQAGEPSYGGELDAVVSQLRGLHQAPQPVRVVDSLRKVRRSTNSSRSEPLYQPRLQGREASPRQASSPNLRDASPQLALSSSFRSLSKSSVF